MKKFEAFCELFPVGELGDYLLEEPIDIYVQERKAGRNTGDAYLLQHFTYTMIISLSRTTRDILTILPTCIWQTGLVR